MKRFAYISARVARRVLATSLKVATLCFTCALSDDVTFAEETLGESSPLFESLTRGYSWMRSEDVEGIDESSTREASIEQDNGFQEHMLPYAQEMGTVPPSLVLAPQYTQRQSQDLHSFWDERSADFEVDISGEATELLPPRVLRNFRMYETQAHGKRKGLFHCNESMDEETFKESFEMKFKCVA